jgi:hypothetical protein
MFFFSYLWILHRLTNTSLSENSRKNLLPFCEADILFNIPIIRDGKNPSILAKANSG